MPTAIEIPSAVDFGSLSAADQLLAQQRYQNALTSGYDEDTAAALYLAPMQAKWKIIRSNPTEFQDPDKLAKINSDFEDATASAVRNTTRDTSAAEAIGTRIAPLLQSWSAVGKKPTLDPAQELQLRDLRSEMNRLNREKSYYGRYLRTGVSGTDPLKDSKVAAATEALAKSDAMLNDVRAEYQDILRGGAQPEPSAAAALTAPPQFAPSQQIGLAEMLAGTPPDSGIQVPGPEPFVAPTIPTTPAPTAAAALAKKPLIFIAGRPDLSTVSREEADRSWAAQFPVTKSDVSAADALTRQAAIDVAKSQLPDFTGIPAPAPKNAKAKEVVRLTRDGRRAVFDSDTKKFLRFAD